MVDDHLPDRETARVQGWTHQVNWIDQGRPCFIRCRSGQAADRHADFLKGSKGVTHLRVVDLKDALQLH